MHAVGDLRLRIGITATSGAVMVPRGAASSCGTPRRKRRYTRLVGGVSRKVCSTIPRRPAHWGPRWPRSPESSAMFPASPVRTRGASSRRRDVGTGSATAECQTRLNSHGARPCTTDECRHAVVQTCCRTSPTSGRVASNAARLGTIRATGEAEIRFGPRNPDVVHLPAQSAARSRPSGALSSRVQDKGALLGTNIAYSAQVDPLDLWDPPEDIQWVGEVVETQRT